MRNKKYWIIAGVTVLAIVMAGGFLFLQSKPGQTGDDTKQITNQEPNLEQEEKEEGKEENSLSSLETDGKEVSSESDKKDESDTKKEEGAGKESQTNVTGKEENETPIINGDEEPMPLPSEPGEEQVPSGEQTPNQGISKPIELPFVPYKG